ncbi:hypothetical protein ABQE93_10500 [Mycolicibacterium sp. XJ662]
MGSEWTFVDGALTRIAPGDGGRTTDGLEPGSLVGQAFDLYGLPIKTVSDSDGSHTLTFNADSHTDAAYQLRVIDCSGLVIPFVGEPFAIGTVTSVALCSCKR